MTLKELWQKTIGKSLKENKEKANRDNLLKQEILEESRDEIKATLKKKIVQEEVERLSTTKKNPLQVLAGEFKSLPGMLNTDDKLKTMMSSKTSDSRVNPSKGFGTAPVIDKTKHIGKIKTDKQDFDDKIKKILGR